MFVLKRINDYAGTLCFKADFSYASNLEIPDMDNSVSFRATPTFNRDNKFYTPSFILLEDKVNLSLF
jgi:hypothetical protein